MGRASWLSRAYPCALSRLHFHNFRHVRFLWNYFSDAAEIISEISLFRYGATVWNYFTLKLFYFTLKLIYFNMEPPFKVGRCNYWLDGVCCCYRTGSLQQLCEGLKLVRSASPHSVLGLQVTTQRNNLLLRGFKFIISLLRTNEVWWLAYWGNSLIDIIAYSKENLQIYIGPTLLTASSPFPTLPLLYSVSLHPPPFLRST